MTYIPNPPIPSSCQGCAKTFKRPSHSLTYYKGHYLCGICKRRTNMPFVGYKSYDQWKKATRPILLPRIPKAQDKKVKPVKRIRTISDSEEKVLWREYKEHGLGYKRAKKRIINLKKRLKG